MNKSFFVCLLFFLIIFTEFSLGYDSAIVSVSNDVSLMARADANYTFGLGSVLNVYEDGIGANRMTSLININPDSIPSGVIRQVKLFLYSSTNQLTTLYPRLDSVTVEAHRVKENWDYYDTIGTLASGYNFSPSWHYRDTTDITDTFPVLGGTPWSDTAAFYPTSSYILPEGSVVVDSSSDAEFELTLSPHTMTYYRDNPDFCNGWVLTAQSTGNQGEHWKRQFYSSKSQEPSKQPYYLIVYDGSAPKFKNVDVSGDIEF